MHISFIYPSYTHHIPFNEGPSCTHIPFTYSLYTLHIPFINPAYTLHIPSMNPPYALHIPIIYPSHILHSLHIPSIYKYTTVRTLHMTAVMILPFMENYGLNLPYFIKFVILFSSTGEASSLCADFQDMLGPLTCNYPSHTSPLLEFDSFFSFVGFHIIS